MVNGKCEALREGSKGFFANPGHFNTETSKSIKCNFETFRFSDFQTSETNRLFETLKKNIESVRQLCGKRNSRLTTQITAKNLQSEFVNPTKILGRPMVFEGPFTNPNNDRVTKFLRHTLDHEK